MTISQLIRAERKPRGMTIAQLSARLEATSVQGTLEGGVEVGELPLEAPTDAVPHDERCRKLVDAYGHVRVGVQQLPGG